MRTWLATGLLIAAVACRDSAAPSASEGAAGVPQDAPLQPLDASALALMGAVVDSFPYYYRANPARGLRVFVEDRTLAPASLTPPPTGIPDWVDAAVDSVALAEAIADHERANRTPRAVAAIQSSYAPAIFDRPELPADDAVASRVGYARRWTELLTEMSDSMTVSIAVFTFSVPGFSSDSSVAFIEVDYGCAGLCGDRRQLVLRREGTVWRTAGKHIGAVY